MKKLLFIGASILSILFILSVTINSQKIKLSNFKFVVYDIENNTVSISSYSTLDKNGVLRVYLKRYNDTVFYKYQLTKEEIEKVNKLSSKKLQNFVEKKQLENNSYYAGSRNYMNFKVKNKDEKLCFIQPFMSSEFSEIMNLLTEKIYKQDETAITSGFKIDFEAIRNDILRQNEIDNYLPQKQLPPPPMKKFN
ncbi:MAG: hypothetical protein E6Q35_10305 [Chryseobacterium cucumeris]|uniref:hypothetical protein n=1 Tax=Chryseobacterium TaxID=59732 RepID=UPI000EC23B27|nr:MULTISPECIES: hypothetical protein [Chryseobacterium]TXI95064.1 MAG: hypothetical protein E6Q35_10305 [Chryseobacterium cucumeris]HCM34207.1 hypothetical protein [Chryseobacterium sp.]